MSKSPRVGVIISNYNYGEYVCGAIESAINQDYDNLEIVVVDDCSTDDSVSKIMEYLQYDTPTKLDIGSDLVRYQANKGKDITFFQLRSNVKQGAARNEAIRECWDRCDYFAILDSDDEMLPTKVSKCISRHLEYPDSIGSVHTDYYIENLTEGFTVQEFKPSYSKDLLMRECHLHSGGVISKRALQECGLFDTECPPKEDYLMWLKISDKFMCINIPEPLVKVRVTSKNSTVSNTDEFHQKQFALMVDKYNEWRREKNLQ